MNNVGWDAQTDSRIRCRLSIIVPVYNVEAYLMKCLESIVTQLRGGTAEQVEVILVDDGSVDHSGEIADAYGSVCPCVQVIHKKNAGVAAARNDGMDAARGEWLYFMDSDDWMSQDGIPMLLRALTECAQSDMILFEAWQNTGARELPWEHFGREAVWDSRDEIRRLQRGVLYYSMDYPGTRVPLAAPWDKLYRRAFLTENQLRFKEMLPVLDDMVFNMEVLGKAELVAYRKYRVCHYRHVSSSITNRFRADRVEEDKKVWGTIEQYRLGLFSDETGKAQLQAFDQAYFCRVIRSFAICCRRSLYHRDNGKSYREKQEHVREVTKLCPYSDAFLRVQKQNLEWRLRPVVFMVRHDLYGGLYLLYLAEKCFEAVKGRWPGR